MLMMHGVPVVWRSTFQNTVALSSNEAEYIALSDCVKEVVWMRLLLKDIGSEQDNRMVIYEANQGAMALANNVGLEYVDTKNQLADYLTKGLSTKLLRYLVDRSNFGSKPETSN
ncbi:hypothetical protein PC128_g14842 [Phytophthora cactorum]|nr:hypothetical protein PC128_g14842 [Phytophthora cactorum]